VSAPTQKHVERFNEVSEPLIAAMGEALDATEYGNTRCEGMLERESSGVCHRAGMSPGPGARRAPPGSKASHEIRIAAFWRAASPNHSALSFGFRSSVSKST
jgi:hypothetical protein